MGVSLDDYLEGGERSGLEIEPDAPTSSADDDFDIEEFSIGDWVEITRGYTDPDIEDEVRGYIGTVENIDKDDEDYPLLINCKGDMHWVYRAVLIDPPEDEDEDDEDEDDEDDSALSEDRPTTGDRIVVTKLEGVTGVPLPQVVEIKADDKDSAPYLCTFITDGDEEQADWYVMEENCYPYTGDRTDTPFVLEDEKSWLKKREDLWQAYDEARLRLTMHLSADLRPSEWPRHLVRAHGLVEGEGRRIDAIKDLRFVWQQRMGVLSLADAKALIEEAIRTERLEKEGE